MLFFLSFLGEHNLLSNKKLQPPHYEGVAILISGGARGDRTLDLLTASQTRSQLRHSPNRLVVIPLLGRFVNINPS